MGRFFNIDRLAEKYEAISPYAYVANNPIKFIDINGEWINIYDSGNKYRYMTGGQVQQWSSELGRWETVQMSEVSTYVATIIESIYELESSGATGGAVVGYFANDSKNVRIGNYEDMNGYSANVIRLNVDSDFITQNVPTTNGDESMPIYLTLGHEMAHVIDYYENKEYYMDNWLTTNSDKPIKRSEIFATHIENQIRSESGLPLRTYYGKYDNNKVIRNTRLIDKNGNSLYYNQTAPSIFMSKDRGEIFNNKYNHIKTKDRYNYKISNPVNKK